MKISLKDEINYILARMHNEITKKANSYQYIKYKSKKWTYQRWDQVPWRSKHPLSTG
jgi:hypothetical protein